MIVGKKIFIRPTHIALICFFIFGIAGAAYENSFTFFDTSFKNNNGEIQEIVAQSIMLQSQGRHQDAVNLLHQTLQKNPAISDLFLSLGKASNEIAQYENAYIFLKNVVTLDPGKIEGYMALSDTLIHMHLNDQALQQADYAVRLAPRNVDALVQLSKIHIDCTLNDQALKIAEYAASLEPNNTKALLRLATAQLSCEQVQDALKTVQKVLTIDPHSDKAYHVLGCVYYKLGEVDQALVACQKSLAISPHAPQALLSMGITLMLLNRLDEALSYLHHADQVKVDFTHAHTALFDAYMAKGDLEHAWMYHRKLWKYFGVDPSKMGVPLWDGSNVQGKTIFLYAEQGLGDTFQFIRYAKILKEQGATVICRVQKGLETLCAKLPYIDEIIAEGQGNPTIYMDYQVPLLYLPGILKTRKDTIPAPIPYLWADAKLINLWKSNIAADKNFKIGVCWHMEAQHEVGLAPWAKRTLSPALFESLTHIPNISLYSLQKENNQTPAFIRSFGQNFDRDHGRFMDTAALIMNMDLIITVDTSIAHLAGALGKKVWMILPYAAAPRWYREGDTTAWYPNMRLFRQPKPYDPSSSDGLCRTGWQPVIEQLVVALNEHVQNNKSI